MSPGETLPVSDSSVDLVTALSAVHWFDVDMFLSEVDRVLRPGGCIFLAAYPLIRIKTEDALVNEQIDKAMDEVKTRSCLACFHKTQSALCTVQRLIDWATCFCEKGADRMTKDGLNQLRQLAN